MQEIKEPVAEMEYEKAREQGLIQEIYPLNEYLDSIMDTVDMEAIRERNLRVALDPMYGVSETSLRVILQTARCEVVTIHDRHDTLFGGHLPSVSPRTVTQTESGSSTIPGVFCIPMRSWCCCIIIWRSTRAGEGRLCAISVPPMCWTE